MKKLLFLLLFAATSAGAQDQRIFPSGLWMLPMDGGQCEFEIDGERLFRPIFNPQRVYSIFVRYDPERTMAFIIKGRNEIIFEPDTLAFNGWFFVREPSVDYKIFPLAFPGDSERSQYIATPSTVRDLACGCYVKKSKISVEINTLPMIPLKRIFTQSIRA